MSERMRRSLATRWLGAGLAASLAVVTLVLAITGRLSLYLNPDSAWFAVAMAVLVLAGAVASFALPLGDENEHGHDHDHDHAPVPRTPLARAGALTTATGGALASGVVLAMLLTPPAALSTDLAMARDVGGTPLFAGADAITLAASGDTTTFGVGEWAGVFASATDPDAFEGTPVTLTGFVTPGEDGTFDLTRLVITHCVIDAQPASLPVTDARAPETGQWVRVTGTVRADADGSLRVEAAEVTPIDEPQDPYEY